MSELSRWHCPHPECEDGREYSDPPNILVTVCDKDHEVILYHDPQRDYIGAALAEDDPETAKIGRDHAELMATAEILARRGLLKMLRQ